MDTLMQDLKYATRTLARARGFAALAILTLALGIGGTTAIHSVVDAVLLEPLPFPDASRLVVPRSVDRATGDDWALAYADFLDWRDAGIFQHVSVFQRTEMDLAGQGDPMRVAVTNVSEQFFDALGVSASLGRTLQPGDNALDRASVVVLADALWRGRFGADPDIVGRVIRMNGLERIIVGVMAPGVEWPTGTDVWSPMRIANPAAVLLASRDNFTYEGIARLARTETLESTRARLDALAQRVELEYPATRRNVGITAIPATQALLGDTLPRTLWLLLGAVTLVLLIGCVNIANLMLARAGARQRELALRTALGATRGRLVRQILTESAVLAAIGGILGTVLAVWCVSILTTMAPATIPRIAETTVSYAALGTALLLSIACAFLFGLIPALQASATRPGSALGEGSQRLAGGRRARKGRSVLVIVEMAIALMLLTGAGLLTHSLLRLQNTDPGFQTARVLTFSVALPSGPGSRYASPAARRTFFANGLERLTTLPGVEAASMASALPLGAGGFYIGRGFLAEGWAEPPATAAIEGNWNVVAPGFFEALRVPLLRGRDFTARDDSASTPVIIINASFAARVFPGQDPIGKRVRSWPADAGLREVVGVVDDVRYYGPDDAKMPLVYVPYGQDAFGRMRFVVRTIGEPAGVVAAARRAIAALDPDVALALASTMNEAVDTALATPRFTTYLLGGFAGMALLLVAVGLYGVLSYSIAQRTREIGIRMALGARSGTVLRMVVREAVVLVTLGIVVGSVGALALSSVVESLLFEVTPTDPVTMAVVISMLAVVGAVAAWIPARRATRVDPLIALRSED
jgi:predicted permease